MPLTRNQASAAAQSKTGGTESADASMSKDGAEQGGPSSESDPPRRDSPENCSICLGPFNNKSFTSSCAHSFCFVCLKQWSKVKAECPLCKQPFTSIFHNIRSNQMYDIYELPRQPPNQVNQYNIYTDYVGSGLTTFAAPTHHYLSLTQPFDADLTLSNFSRFQFRHRRYDRYLNPLSIQGEHPYSFTSPSVNPTAHVSAASWPRGSEDFRREVYRHNLGPPFVILGNENSTYRLTPAMVAASSHRLHRIMPWLTRELRVLFRSHQSVRLAISMIQPLLTQVSVDSVSFHDRVATFIGRRSRTFIQEFAAFANSALSMQAFDRKAMYRRRDESVAASSPSSTSSENDVIEITDVSPDPIIASSVIETQTASSQPLDLRRSGWDSPTPGPSWINLGSRDPSVQAVPIDRVSVSSESEDPVFIPQHRDSDSENSRAGSDIIFVKYDKPWEDRSPINLTSDIEKDPEPERVKKKKKSKHKKKRKELTERNESMKKDKSHKSSKGKSHGREKSKSSSKVESGEERGASSHKRRHSLSSPDYLLKKKRKKSKEKREKSSDANNDRELVDRLFAEVFSQHKGNNHVSTLEEKTGDSPKSGKEKERSSRSSTKDRSKRKKKSKNHSRDSRSPSYSHSFKKHHSGHKKSTNAARLSQSSHGERIHHKASSVEGEKVSVPPSRTSRRDSMDYDRDPLNQPHSSSSISHPITPGYQPPYLPLPDTVQHIPVNLWVSTWPALPVSHTYHATHPPPPSSNLPGSSHSAPQNPSSSFPPVATSQNIPGPSTAALDSHTISSDSSTDYDSDNAPDRQIPSLKNVDPRTMHWLETHCPDLGRLQPGSSSITEAHTASVSSTSTSSSSSSSSDTATSSIVQRPLEPIAQTVEREIEESHINVEVLSVGSGDEDVVICSSTSDSDSDAVHCVEEECPQVNPCAVAFSNSKGLEPTTSTSKFLNSVEKSASTLPFLSDFSNPKVQSASVSLILPSTNKSFQPFKLQKKSALTHQGKDPFFPAMSHSSDEDDGNVDKPQSSQPQNSPLKESMISSQPSEDLLVPHVNALGAPDLIRGEVISSISNEETDIDNSKFVVDSTKSDEEIESWNIGKGMKQPSEVQTVEINQATFPTSTISTSGPAMFSVLPSIPRITAPLTTVLHSNLNYLAYSSPAPSFSPTSVPSYLLPPFSFNIPPASTTLSSRPSFSTLNSVLRPTQTHTSLPPIYPSVNKDSSNSVIVSPEEVLSGSCGVGTSLSSQSRTTESNTYLPPINREQTISSINTNYSSENPTNHCNTETSTSNSSQKNLIQNDTYEMVECFEKSDGMCLTNGNEKPSDLLYESDSISNHQAGPANTSPQNEDANEHASFNILNLYDYTDKVVPYSRDFLEPEENILTEDAVSVSVKNDQVFEPSDAFNGQPDLPSHFPRLSVSLDNNIDQISNSDERNAPDTLSSGSDNKDTESAQNLSLMLNVENKSMSSLSCENIDYAMPNGQESQLMESLVSSNSSMSESADRAVEANLGQCDSSVF